MCTQNSFVWKSESLLRYPLLASLALCLCFRIVSRWSLWYLCVDTPPPRGKGLTTRATMMPEPYNTAADRQLPPTDKLTGYSPSQPPPSTKATKGRKGGKSSIGRQQQQYSSTCDWLFNVSSRRRCGAATQITLTLLSLSVIVNYNTYSSLPLPAG